MIHGIGVDIADTARFRRFLDEDNRTLLDRLFTAAEQEYCCSAQGAADRFAARFAAKEAFLKALGTGLRDGLSWHDMEIVNDGAGRPSFTLSGRALQLCSERGVTNHLLSLSHDGGSAVAMVVLEGP